MYGHDLGEKRATVIEACLKEKQTFLEDQLKNTKERSLEVQRQLDQDQQALAILKNNLSNCKDISQTGGGAPATSHPPVSNAGEAEVQVISGETAKVFSRQIFITLSAIQPSPTPPPRYEAFVTLGAPGKKSEDIHGYAGVSVLFAGYEVRIIQVDAASARFHVRKLSPAATTTP